MVVGSSSRQTLRCVPVILLPMIHIATLESEVAWLLASNQQTMAKGATSTVRLHRVAMSVLLAGSFSLAGFSEANGHVRRAHVARNCGWLRTTVLRN